MREAEFCETCCGKDQSIDEAMQPPSLMRATLFYDADCGFCRWAVAKVMVWDRARAIRVVALQDRAEAERLLTPMDEETRMSSWHLVIEGRVHSAGKGVAPLLRLLPGGGPAARVATAAQPLTDRLYDFVAARRAAFGRLVPRRAQERADERLRTSSR
jgi:predicted DCC family thiol-disulfide oxidoreductase YuxK